MYLYLSPFLFQSIFIARKCEMLWHLRSIHMVDGTSLTDHYHHPCMRIDALTSSLGPPADFRTPALTAATTLRWDSRCASVPAPIRSDLRLSATVSPWILASATLRSSGSPRNRAARSSTDCSSGSSEGATAGYLNGSNRAFMKLNSNPCLERETPLKFKLFLFFLTTGGATTVSKYRHCLHFMFQTLIF